VKFSLVAVFFVRVANSFSGTFPEMSLQDMAFLLCAPEFSTG